MKANPIAHPPRTLSAAAGPARYAVAFAQARTRGLHLVALRDARGTMLALETFANLVTTGGKNYLLAAGLANATPAIAAWYVGMIAENRHAGDGATTSGSATLSSATANFAAGDAGRQITVYGAGTGGANLATTIASVTNSTTAAMANAAGATTTNAIVSIGPLLAAADTMGAHPGWIEVAASQLQQTTRPAWTPGSVSGGSVNDDAAPVLYTMSASLAAIVYIHGLFLVSDATLGGAAGTLYSEGAFTQGALAVQAGYSVSDSYTVGLS